MISLICSLIRDRSITYPFTSGEMLSEYMYNRAIFVSCPDVVPQSLGQGRTVLGGREREGKGRTEGTCGRWICLESSAFSLAILLWAAVVWNDSPCLVSPSCSNNRNIL